MIMILWTIPSASFINVKNMGSKFIWTRTKMLYASLLSSSALSDSSQWSRFSGGSGAPYWTFPACGIDPQAFTATQAAIVHCEYPGSSDTPDPAALPSMIWATNYGRLASQTLFALFFGGKTFAPKCILDGVHIQDYLQSHFIQAFGVLGDRIRDAGGLLDDVVIGWDSMNEPSEEIGRAHV